MKRENTEARLAQMREYNRNHMKQILDYQNKYKLDKIKKDPLYRLEINIRRLFQAHRKNGGYKATSKLNWIIGLPYNDYITYIESTWAPGMNWSNYGRKKGCWNIDHIISPSSGRDVAEVTSLFHFLNTRALWAEENTKKKNY